MKLAVFLPNWVGDAAMATPALAAIRTDFPDAEIVGVMRPVIADVLAGSGLMDRVLLSHPRGQAADHRGWRFIARLRAERCDTAILFPNSLRSAWLAWLSGARRRIGFDRDLRGWLLTDRVTPKSKAIPHPVLDEYNRLAERLGCTSLSRRMTLAVTSDDVATLDAFWSRQRPGLRERGVVAINTGGAFGPAKNWPKESFVKLAQRIVDELGRTVLVLCGPAEREEAQWIAEHAARDEVITFAFSGSLSPVSGERVKVKGPSASNDSPTPARSASKGEQSFPLSLGSPLLALRADDEHRTSAPPPHPDPLPHGGEGTEPKTTRLSIGLTKAAVRDCELLVTTDSGPRHFAAAFDVPVVTLFGPTHIAWSETHYPKATHLQLAVDCGPCQQRECPLGHHRCMRDLTVEQVFAAVRERLRSNTRSAA